MSKNATATELKAAYRRALRHSHPDAGGSATSFQQVQDAWNLVGTAAARSAYDRGAGRSYSDVGSFAREAGGRNQGSVGKDGTKTRSGGVRARSLGHPGGPARERYLTLVREWVGRGATIDDPYDPSLVQSAPREIRRLLAKALAEESTARLVSELGIGYTIWNAIDTPGGIDHVVLGPAGLFAINSEDPGDPVTVRRAELVLSDDQNRATKPPPIRGVKELTKAARTLAKTTRVKFTGMLLVLPDECLDEAIVPIGRRAEAAVIRRSVLPRVLRNGITGEDSSRLSLEENFDVRAKLLESIRLH